MVVKALTFFWGSKIFPSHTYLLARPQKVRRNSIGAVYSKTCRVSKSSQDSLVARPRYLDAEGFMGDLDEIVQIGGVGSPIELLTTFMGDFVAFVIQISDLSEETERTAPDKTTSPWNHELVSPPHSPRWEQLLILCPLFPDLWEEIT